MNAFKVVVVANCQARPWAELLKKMNSSVEITAIAIVHLLKDENYDEFKEKFNEADLIISQLVNEDYPCRFVRTSELKKKYGSKVISVVNLYFNGYNPDWFYIRLNQGKPLRGPMGDYQNKTILESWRRGLPVSEAARNLESHSYNKKYTTQIKVSLEELRTREQLADVKIADVVEKFFKKERLFFTFNHPSMFLMRKYAERMMSHIGLKKKFHLFRIEDKEMLDQFIPLTNPSVGLPSGKNKKHRGVECEIVDQEVAIKGRKEYTSLELCEYFYRIYDTLGDHLNLNEYPDL